MDTFCRILCMALIRVIIRVLNWLGLGRSPDPSADQAPESSIPRDVSWDNAEWWNWIDDDEREKDEVEAGIIRAGNDAGRHWSERRWMRPARGKGSRLTIHNYRVENRSCNMSGRSGLTASCFPSGDDLIAEAARTWVNISKTSFNNISSIPFLHRCPAVARCSLPLFADMSTCISHSGTKI